MDGADPHVPLPRSNDDVALPATACVLHSDQRPPGTFAIRESTWARIDMLKAIAGYTFTWPKHATKAFSRTPIPPVEIGSSEIRRSNGTNAMKYGNGIRAPSARAEKYTEATRKNGIASDTRKVLAIT